MSRAPRPEDQLRRFAGNLVTPDVYSAYSSTYSWVSNQTAHVGLGLLVAVLVLALARGVRSWPPHWFLLLFFGPYVLKECYDFANGLRLDKNVLPRRLGELWWDVLADLFFVSCGIALAISVFGAWPGVEPWWAGLAATGALFVAGALLFGRHAVPRRRAYDKSGLPFYFRLALYEADFTPEDVQGIGEFLEGGATRHVLVHGDCGSGKTTLAAAVGGDLCVREELVRYLSAAKLAEQLQTAIEPTSSLGEPWTLDEARVLVVDDLDPESWTRVLHIEALARQLAEKRSMLVFAARADPDSVREALGISAEDLHAIDTARLGFRPPRRRLLRWPPGR